MIKFVQKSIIHIMKKYLYILAVLSAVLAGTHLFASEQPEGEEIVISSEGGDARSLNGIVYAYKTNSSIDVYFQHYSGIASVSIADSFGQEVASASSTISGSGRISVPLTGLTPGTYHLKIAAGNEFVGVFII